MLSVNTGEDLLGRSLPEEGTIKSSHIYSDWSRGGGGSCRRYRRPLSANVQTSRGFSKQRQRSSVLLPMPRKGNESFRGWPGPAASGGGRSALPAPLGRDRPRFIVGYSRVARPRRWRRNELRRPPLSRSRKYVRRAPKTISVHRSRSQLWRAAWDDFEERKWTYNVRKSLRRSSPSSTSRRR